MASTALRHRAVSRGELHEDGTRSPLRELDHRAGDGMRVWLLWRPDTNRVAIAVEDERSERFLWFEVDGADAHDAFNHPYVYASAARHNEPLAARASWRWNDHEQPHV
jgi:hypothetical protein